MGSYGVVVEPLLRLRVTSYRPALPNWPAALALRIAVLADPHFNKPFMPLWRAEEIVERTNALAPDLVVLLGDFDTSHRLVMEHYDHADVAHVLAQLRAPLGVVAVMGNHDWWADERALQRERGPLRIAEALERAGIRCLENSAERFFWKEHPFWIAGLGDQYAFRLPGGGYRGVDDLPATLAAIDDDAPVILLAHEPDIFPSVPDRVALTLSGHTHGGQIVLAGYAPVVPSRYGRRYRYGHIVENERHLIVSGGLGCSILPVRIGMPPEIVMIETGSGTA